jgi:hypothetical protein
MAFRNDALFLKASIPLRRGEIYTRASGTTFVIGACAGVPRSSIDLRNNVSLLSVMNLA